MVAFSAGTLAVTINLSRLVVVASATRALFSSCVTQNQGSVLVKYKLFSYMLCTVWYISNSVCQRINSVSDLAQQCESLFVLWSASNSSWFLPVKV